MNNFKYYILIFIILFIFNCKSLGPKNKKQTNTEKKYHEKVEDLAFVNFNYSINTEESNLKQNDIYEIKYLINFKFKSKNNNFKISYTLYDENNNTIIKKEQLKPMKDNYEKNIYFIKDFFRDIINYQKIKYLVTVNINNKNIEYTGEYENLTTPKLTDFNIGPIISTYVNNKLNISLSINLKLINNKGIKWIHFIPPSLDSYWDITWDVNYLKYEVTVNKLVHEENSNYIENGKYLLQINLNKYGLIQKEIEIIDISGNKDNKNFGLPIINVENIDKKKIKLDTLLLDKIDFIELWFYDKDINKKIGYAKLKPKDEILIDYLIKQVKDENNKIVKIKYNKEYKVKIYSYSKEINGIKYISISDSFILNIKKFKLFPF